MSKSLFMLSVLLLSPVSFYSNAQSVQPLTEQQSTMQPEKQRLLGLPVYVRIIKEDKVLELFVKNQGAYQLVQTYPICNYSGDLGPKRYQGDFKSPEGFYQVTMQSLNPNSKFYRSFNLGYPNQYDQEHGFTGKHLMVHGDCVSTGCYAMNNQQISEIYQFIEYALINGQPQVEVNIFPFRMTNDKLNSYSHSVHYEFWQQLKAGYDFFEKTHQPPNMIVSNGRYNLAPQGLLANNPPKTNPANPFAAR
ncbi:murein L,D-transpeptidase [Budviciaceae bacterium BWR-B9]|uniref:Murein L,D-transpeptidase n=1 Tax=Limnobaculum allomyrinae TaxID=2791986 RepID=A0ABS1IUN5_9GAMM|nr:MULTISPECIES: murein L,D-transpeptidase family protein [Limnobaculum]MBK5145448.1 murein L,D-transpeptidase [Limnobaculum allomyrinae]MBV7693124.1 murein L,D-transpeptidase [Limnobaculum sp. M2-1]